MHSLGICVRARLWVRLMRKRQRGESGVCWPAYRKRHGMGCGHVNGFYGLNELLHGTSGVIERK